ncbi:hypothetical protein [Micromonospora sp. NPDC051006]|uniref:hypothetical protein n=1 Tax=Micromonospora sp. NPDC051006 TaxID=3364283 RepID=UPI00379EEFF5
MNADQFAGVASLQQAALFAAGCAERACGVLFWAVSEDDRRDDLDRYHEALELLWRPLSSDVARYSSTRSGLERMREMRFGDELEGSAAHALYAAVVLHSALGMLARRSLDGLAECSAAARNGAFRIGARTGHHLVLDLEERCQAEDVERLLDGGSADELRESARRRGRERLRLLYEHYRR